MYLIKHLILFILFSLGVIYGAQHIQPLILVLVSSRNWISQLLLQVLPRGGELGFAFRNVLSLLIVPFFIGAIPVSVYWLSKKRLFPYFMHVVWGIWLVQTAAIVVLQRVVF